MRKYLLIGAGGFIGAILRHELRSIRIGTWAGAFPVQTLVINLAGCFLLAALFALAAGSAKIKPDLKLGIATGFLGAFTTFSTMCKEIASLAAQGRAATAVAYAAIALLLGLAACSLGQRAALAGLGWRRAVPAPVQPDITSEGGEEA